MLDRYGRRIDYMRVSVTDKCNLRCRYCMPEGVEIVPMDTLLTFEEITEVCSAGAELGIGHIRITGGEPLVRRGVPELVRMIKALPGIRKVTMTTNGILLAQHMDELLRAGLDGINISLDTLKPEVYREISGKDRLSETLSGLRSAVSSGLPVKINAVLMKSINDGEWEDLLLLAEKEPVDVRFIEMMPIGAGARFGTVPNPELLEMIRDRYPGLQEDPSSHGSGPAVYYRIPGFAGSIGFISAIHGKFCGSCNRIRLTAMGDLKPCLCYAAPVNVRELLRSDRKGELPEVLREAIWQKPQGHCFEDPGKITEKNRMISIGG